MLQTPTDDEDDRRRQTHGEQNNTAPPTLCVGGPVISIWQPSSGLVGQKLVMMLEVRLERSYSNRCIASDITNWIITASAFVRTAELESFRRVKIADVLATSFMDIVRCPVVHSSHECC